MNNQDEIGFVISMRDFSIYLEGLPTIKINDMVISEEGSRGWVSAINESSVEVLMVDEGKTKLGQTFKRLPNRLSLPVGEFLLGRAINPLAVPIDGKGPIAFTSTSKVFELERTAPGIETREFISKQFLTGVTLIDSLIPLGKGQRELVMGDAHSGKTQFLIDTILNQKGTSTICIYASIGKPAVAVRSLIDVLKANGALEYTSIIATSSSEPAPLIFLTPKTAFALAEYFQSKGRDVLLILDDLGSHAKIYREIALLSNRAPGRESYPGDIFYQHAHLLERAGKFLPEFGGGSITTLPVIELNLTDFTTLIPTNLMSMTDGHLLFRSSLRSQGQYPAIDLSLSVSRVGRQTQDQLSNLLSTEIRQLLSHTQDLETIARFSSELSPETQLILQRKNQIDQIIQQEPFTNIPKDIQVILLTLPFTSFFKDKTGAFIEMYKPILTDSFINHPELKKITSAVPTLTHIDELITLLESSKIVLTQLCP